MQEKIHLKTKANVIVSISGGKDSTACLLLALERGHQITAMFNDTGWEHPLNYEYLDYLANTLGIEIHRTVYEPAPTMYDLIRKFKRYPRVMTRFCTSRFKVTASRQFYNKLLAETENQGKGFVAWYGMRTQESSGRLKRYGELEDDEIYELDDLFPKVYGKKLQARIKAQLPIVSWSEQRVFDFIASCGIKRNPLYDMGESRVGCYPCFLSSKAVINANFSTEVGRQRLAELYKLDAEVGTDIRKWIKGVPTSGQGGCAICSI